MKMIKTLVVTTMDLVALGKMRMKDRATALRLRRGVEVVRLELQVLALRQLDRSLGLK